HKSESDAIHINYVGMALESMMEVLLLCNLKRLIPNLLVQKIRVYASLSWIRYTDFLIHDKKLLPL
ncbi:hypothetical protein, partial [uncultured Clostridium sp.]|uniref:hypothetical protein n=1 Tax=uncultured Clostridium sp. TaxID=59620 RepID=UPI002625E918